LPERRVCVSAIKAPIENDSVFFEYFFSFTALADYAPFHINHLKDKMTIFPFSLTLKKPANLFAVIIIFHFL